MLLPSLHASPSPRWPRRRRRTPARTAETGTAAKGNLFTEKQARTHLLRLGYAEVSGLTKDENGVWHGTASKDGQQRNVAVDVKGGVTK